MKWFSAARRFSMKAGSFWLVKKRMPFGGRMGSMLKVWEPSKPPRMSELNCARRIRGGCEGPRPVGVDSGGEAGRTSSNSENRCSALFSWPSSPRTESTR